MTIFEALCELLDRHAARYRIIDHPAEGRSQAVAAIRGTEVGQGAKALVCRVKISSNRRANVLAVFPADQQASLDKIAKAVAGKKASLAEPDTAKALTRCEMGAVPPFSFNEELQLVVDPTLAERYSEIAFNAGRLDKSIILATEDYLRIASPLLTPIIR